MIIGLLLVFLAVLFAILYLLSSVAFIMDILNVDERDMFRFYKELGKND